MDFVVTEAGIHAAQNGQLKRITAAACRERARALCNERGLPRQRGDTAAGFTSPPCYAGEFPGYFGEGNDAKS
jgi:hypothetical protein